MAKQIDPLDYASQIARALPEGILLTTKADGRVNTMTIGWGAVGVDWGERIFTAYVREYRFSLELIDKNPEFTINVPFGKFDKTIIGKAGSISGRYGDKMSKLDVTLVDPRVISVPAIAELPLTLECRVMYRQSQVISAMQPHMQERWYPQDVPSTDVGSNKDTHVVLYGQIVAAYILGEDDVAGGSPEQAE